MENRREGGRVRQRIVGSLGRLEDLLASGDLEQVIRQMVEHCPGVKILRLGTKMRGSVIVREPVLSWAGRYREVNERLQVPEGPWGGGGD